MEFLCKCLIDFLLVACPAYVACMLALRQYQGERVRAKKVSKGARCVGRIWADRVARVENADEETKSQAMHLFSEVKRGEWCNELDEFVTDSMRGHAVCGEAYLFAIKEWLVLNPSEDGTKGNE